MAPSVQYHVADTLDTPKNSLNEAKAIRIQEYDVFFYNICKIQSYIFIQILHGQWL
jgi:hypothetical protein